MRLVQLTPCTGEPAGPRHKENKPKPGAASVCKPRLLAQTELLDDCAVTLNILLLQIAEKVSSVTDHLEHAATAVMVLRVVLQVLGERVDAAGENGDLHLGRTGVAFVYRIGCDDVLLFAFQHDFHLMKSNSPVTERRRVKRPQNGQYPTTESRRYEDDYSTGRFICKEFF